MSSFGTGWNENWKYEMILYQIQSIVLSVWGVMLAEHLTSAARSAQRL